MTSGHASGEGVQGGPARPGQSADDTTGGRVSEHTHLLVATSPATQESVPARDLLGLAHELVASRPGGTRPAPTVGSRP